MAYEVYFTRSAVAERDELSVCLRGTLDTMIDVLARLRRPAGCVNYWDGKTLLWFFRVKRMNLCYRINDEGRYIEIVAMEWTEAVSSTRLDQRRRRGPRRPPAQPRFRWGRSAPALQPGTSARAPEALPVIILLGWLGWGRPARWGDMFH
ncbi:MAG: hypothetical protein Q8P41_25165 [Pseudomonadota bacterium]|nr:hypothetical protein [Pseudomonadota bacterium]